MATQQSSQIYRHQRVREHQASFCVVVLAVRSLLEGLTYGDRVSELHERLESLTDRSRGVLHTRSSIP